MLNTNKLVVNNENIEIATLSYLAAYPTIYIRQVALNSVLSKTSILSILWKHKFSFSEVQHLKKTVFTRTVEFCQFILLPSQSKVFLDIIFC